VGTRHGTARATHRFRDGEDRRAGVEAITRGLALISPRCEPVCLPHVSLTDQPRFHCYAIGARKLPEVRALRAAFLGRALHGPLGN